MAAFCDHAFLRRDGAVWIMVAFLRLDGAGWIMLFSSKSHSYIVGYIVTFYFKLVVSYSQRF